MPPAITRPPRAVLPAPVLLLCLVIFAAFAAAPPARAQGGGGSNLTYITYPGEYLYDVARKLETSGSVIRWLNPGKIGPRGRLEPYTRLLIPTSRANRGKVIGAKPPRQMKPPPPKPFKKPIVPATQQPSAPSASNPATPTLPAEESPPPTYETRPSSYEWKPEIGAASFVKPLVSLLAVVGGIFLFLRVVKRRGWESRLAGSRKPPTPQPKADVPAPAERPSFGAHLDAATQAREAPLEESADEEPPAEILSPALLETEEKTNTPNRVEAAEPDPVALEKSLTDTQDMEPPDFSNYVDDDIPQTSLADALRGRRKRF